MYYAEWVYEPHLKVKDLVKRLFGIDDISLGSDKKKQLKIIEALRLVNDNGVSLKKKLIVVY